MSICHIPRHDIEGETICNRGGHHLGRDLCVQCERAYNKLAAEVERLRAEVERLRKVKP